MPSPRQRRDFDSRNGRFESEIRSSEMAKGLIGQRGLYTCSKCHRPFEERSKTCPRCDTKTMCEVRMIPEKHLEEARRKAIERARRV